MKTLVSAMSRCELPLQHGSVDSHTLKPGILVHANLANLSPMQVHPLWLSIPILPRICGLCCTYIDFAGVGHRERRSESEQWGELDHLDLTGVSMYRRERRSERKEVQEGEMRNVCV